MENETPMLPAPESSVELSPLEKTLVEEQQLVIALAEKVKKIDEYLKVGIQKQAEEAMVQVLTPIVEKLNERFAAIEIRLGAGGAAGNSGRSPLELISDITKSITDIARSFGLGAGGGGGGFAGEIETMTRDIIKLDLRDMLNARRKGAGLPALSVQTATSAAHLEFAQK